MTNDACDASGGGGIVLRVMGGGGVGFIGDVGIDKAGGGSSVSSARCLGVEMFSPASPTGGELAGRPWSIDSAEPAAVSAGSAGDDAAHFSAASSFAGFIGDTTGSSLDAEFCRDALADLDPPKNTRRPSFAGGGGGGASSSLSEALPPVGACTRGGE